VTSLLLESEPGDYIGGGQSLFFAAADGIFTVAGNGNAVWVSFHTLSYDSWWYLDFAAPNGAPLVPGLYPGATRYPFQAPSEPGLDVYGDGRGCNMLTGAFEVKEVTAGSAGEILSFRATFEQHCEGAAPALRGEIRSNADVPITLTAPTHMSVREGQTIAFDVTATERDGLPVALSATELPPGALFVDRGDGTGGFTWTTVAGQAGSYQVAFHADAGAGITESVYTRIAVLTPPPPNDELGGAVVVTGVPFTFAQDTSTATTSPDDPSCYGASATVWFAFTPAGSGAVEANTSGSGYDTTLAAYTAGPFGLVQLACDNDSRGLQSRVRLDVAGGTTYYFVVSGYFGFGGGPLVFNVLSAPPPLAVALVLAGSGSVTPAAAGTATVSGTAICSRPVYAFVTGQLTQAHGDAVIGGWFSAAFPCDGKTAWSAPAQAPLALFYGRAAALFTGGPADVSATVFAIDPEAGEWAQASAAARVILRGGR
jgi:hypothetical protein